MRGFILAAGFGTRLRPLTDHIPKALVPFAGAPLLEHAVAFLDECGIGPLGINAHYLPEQIEAFIGQTRRPLTLFVEKPDIRGTGGALDVARSFLSADETFVIANADIVTRFDLKSNVESFEASDDICRLIAFPPEGRGTILFNPETMYYCGTSAEREFHPDAVSADFIGIALYRREFLEFVTHEDFSIIPIWKRAQAAGERVTVAVIREGFWRDLGNPAALAQAHFDLIDGLLPRFTASCSTIDAVRKCRFPQEWSDEVRTRCGPYCWIDEPDFAPQTGAARLVVFSRGRRDNSNNNNGLLVTPWGEIRIDG